MRVLLARTGGDCVGATDQAPGAEWLDLDYHFLTMVSFLLVLGMTVQFAWASIARNVPRVEVPEEMFANAGAVIGAQVRDLRLLLIVISGFFSAAIIGSFCNFLTVIYIGVYLMSDTSGLSHGPYLGTTTVCSLASLLILLIKASVYSPGQDIGPELSPSLPDHKLNLKKLWGMPVLFLSSLVFALGHVIVAYRTSCRARRKLLIHRIDPESILAYKNAFSGCYKVPHSPTPYGAKLFSRSESETKRKALVHDDRDLPISFLADSDSMFIACQGITVHYKISDPSTCLSCTLQSVPCTSLFTYFDAGEWSQMGFLQLVSVKIMECAGFFSTTERASPVSFLMNRYCYLLGDLTPKLLDNRRSSCEDGLEYLRKRGQLVLGNCDSSYLKIEVLAAVRTEGSLWCSA